VRRISTDFPDLLMNAWYTGMMGRS
jgi:hypothetical protein